MLDRVSVGGFLWRLRTWLLGERSSRYQYECRRCGESVSKASAECPACGAAEIARYEL
jgi:ribosomal protein L37E